MTRTLMNTALHHIHRLVAGTGCDQRSDKELLDRFTADHDEEAFVALVRRHGPMVLNVACGVLRHGHDAEDVFQAAFLVLTQKAASIRRRESLGAWLYEVTYHLAVRLQAQRGRWRAGEEKPEEVAGADPMRDITLQEVQQVLHEELGRLPEKYRDPLVLCYLEDKTQEEAARELGWPRGVFRGRLDRGREQLRRRLSARGLTLSAGLLTTALLQRQASASVVTELARATATVASQLSAGQPLAGLVSPVVTQLIEGGAKTMLTRMVIATLLLLVGVVGLSLGVLARHSLSEPPVEKTPEKKPASREEASLPEKAPLRRDLHGDALPSGALLRLGTVRFRHAYQVSSLAFAPDGKTLVSGGMDNTVRLWDSTTGKKIRQLVAHTGAGASHAWVESVAVSRDGKYLAAGIGNGPAAVAVWDLASGKKLHRLDGKQVKVTSVAIDPDSKSLASAGADGSIHLWDLATGRQLRSFKRHKDWVEAVGFSPDGKRLASGSRDRTVRLWDVSTATEVFCFKEPASPVLSVAFSPDGTSLAGGCWQGRIHLWDVASGKERFQLPGGYQATSALVFLADGKTLVSAGWDRVARFWDLATGKELRQLTGHLGPITGLALSPDGKTLATSSWDRTVRLWEVATGKETTPATGHQHGVWRVAYAPDGKTLATGSEDGTARLWDAATGKEIRRLEGHRGIIDLLAFSADGQTLTTGSWDHQLRVWDLATGKRVKQKEYPGTGFTFSADQKRLAGGQAEGRLWVVEAATGKRLQEFKGQSGWVCLAFSPDGRTLASGSEGNNGTVILWEVNSGKELRRCQGDPHRFYALAFSPDGRYLAGASANTQIFTPEGPIYLWDVSTGKEIHRFQGHQQSVGALAFSPDSRTLASASGDGAIRLWEVATGKERHHFTGGQGIVRSLAFSPTGRTLASAHQDTTALIWDVTGLVQEKVPPVPLTPQELNALWADLREADAGFAYRAVWKLASAPEQALPFLRRHLQPVRPAQARVVEKLIADLSSSQFETRRKARAKLETLGELAEPALRDHLKRKLELEERRSVERLLARLRIPAGERLRTLRTVEVLEHLGTAEAQQFLGELARGTPEALLTREAKAASTRLAR